MCRSSPCSAVVTQSGSVVFRPPTSATLDSSRPSRAIPLPAGVSFHPSTPQTAAASGLGRWLLGSHVNLLEAGLLDEVADGLLQVVDPGTHLVDPADDGVGHLLEAGLLRIVKGRGTRAAHSVLFVCLWRNRSGRQQNKRGGRTRTHACMVVARNCSGSNDEAGATPSSLLTICCRRFCTKSVRSAVLFGSWLFDSCEGRGGKRGSRQQGKKR